MTKGLSRKPSGYADTMMKIFDAVSQINIKQNDAWMKIENTYEEVKFLTVSANYDSVILKGSSFTGMLNVNIAISYTDEDDKKMYTFADSITGNFSGKFDAHGEAKIDKVVLTTPDDE